MHYCTVEFVSTCPGLRVLGITHQGPHSFLAGCRHSPTSSAPCPQHSICKGRKHSTEEQHSQLPSILSDGELLHQNVQPGWQRGQVSRGANHPSAALPIDNPKGRWNVGGDSIRDGVPPHVHGVQDDRQNRLAARQLGYSLFWCLRGEVSSGLSLNQQDFVSAATKVGIKQPLTAWNLLDRNGDNQATLEEVISGVEQVFLYSSFCSPFRIIRVLAPSRTFSTHQSCCLQVYDNRATLFLTLRDSQTVVSQVERAIYVSLLVLLAFVSLAIFDIGTLQRTWTGLSAGLLSFSFIFGNSIRQVQSLHVAYVSQPEAVKCLCGG